MVNAVGLQGPGIDAWIDHDLLRCAAGAPSLWGSHGRRLHAGRGAATTAHLIAAVEVNASCPNPHRRSEMFSHDPDAIMAAVDAVVGAEPGMPVPREAFAQCDRHHSHRRQQSMPGRPG